MLAGFCAVVFLSACTGGGKEAAKGEMEEDLTAKELLQGIWLDDDTDMPLMRIEGDTIYYADPRNAPVMFKVFRDSIYLYGNEPMVYKIDRQAAYSFWFHSLPDAQVKLHKSEEPEDSLAFMQREVEVIPTLSEVLKKDSVVLYQGTRYRGYVYVNPSRMKVVKTSYSEGGYAVDNVYYDNVIHICVYEGKNLLYGQDITKKLFASVFPEEFLSQTILADMNFMGVNHDGYQYQATLRVPESSVYTLVDLAIGFDKQLTVKKAE